MTKTGQILKMSAAVIIAVIGVAQGVRASTAAEIAQYITSTSYGDLVTNVSGNTVTVTGSLNGGMSPNADYITLNIDAGVTVIWQAALQGRLSRSYALININGGSGTFHVDGGSIINPDSGRAITNNSTCVIEVSNNASISAGTIADYGGTIYLANYRTETAARLIIRSGFVGNTARLVNYGSDPGVAIHNASTGAVIISGGTVSATAGGAIINDNRDGSVSVSDDAIITSTNSNGQTIDIRYGTLNISGGEVRHTGSVGYGRAIKIYSGVYGSVLNVSGGIVYSEKYHAIYLVTGTVNISGGTVTTNGSNSAAVYNDGIIEGKLNITGGTVSATQSNGYAVYDIEGSIKTVLGGNPTIDSRIFTHPSNLSVTDFASGNDKCYVIDLPQSQYKTGVTAVINGRQFLGNFALYNGNYVLTTAGANLTVASAAYRVSFDLNGGTGTPPATVGVAQSGKLYNKPNTDGFTNAGYISDGEWYIDPDGTTKFVFGENGTTITNNMTLYLKWIEPYTITFDPNGGSVSPASGTTNASGKLASLPEPTRSGYAFVGWYTTAAGSVAVTLDMVYRADAAIYARWGARKPAIHTQPTSATVPIGASGATRRLSVTASVSGDGTLSYQWYAGGTAISGATASAYDAPIDAGGTFSYYVIVKNTITDDIDNTVKSADTTSATATITVEKTTISKPNAPTLASKTYNTITLTEVSSYEYSRDSVNWQSSSVFDGLKSSTKYTFYQRAKETNMNKASDASNRFEAETDKIGVVVIGGIVGGNPRVGDVLTASLVSRYDVGTLSYVWKVNGRVVGNEANYTVQRFNLTYPITLEITSDVESGTVLVASAEAALKSAAPSAPDAPTAASVTHNSVTLAAAVGYEYSMDKAAWQISGAFGGLASNKEYTFYQRKVETKDAYASAASAGLAVWTNAAPLNKTPLDVSPKAEAALAAPAVQTAGGLTAGANPVSRQSGIINFYRQGKQIASCELRIYDISGNVINKVKISDMAIDNQLKRQVGSWDLRDRNGRIVSEGTYLVKGALKTVDGKVEKISLIVSVR